MAAAGDYRRIDIKPFSYSEKGQDIKLFLKRYMWAVHSTLAADADDDAKKDACLRHIPTKLDDLSLQIYEASENQDDWDELQKELIEKLSDPSRKQNFQEQRDYLKWDQKVPLHIFENEVITTTRTLYDEIVDNDALFQREIHQRFLAGLPEDYKDFVDIGLPPRTYDIKKARERAEKYHEIIKKKGKLPLGAWIGNGIAPPQSAPSMQKVSFEASAFKTNQMDEINEKVSQLSLTHKQNLELQKETNANINALIDQLKVQRPQPYQRQRTPSRERDYRRGPDYQRNDYQRNDYQGPNYQRPNYQRQDYQRQDYQRPNYQRQDYQRQDYQQANYQRQPNYDQGGFDQRGRPQQRYQGPHGHQGPQGQQGPQRPVSPYARLRQDQHQNQNDANPRPFNQWNAPQSPRQMNQRQEPWNQWQPHQNDAPQFQPANFRPRSPSPAANRRPNSPYVPVNALHEEDF